METEKKIEEMSIALMIQNYLKYNDIKVSNPLLPLHIEDMIIRERYIKIPEGSVVLTMEEYWGLKQAKTLLEFREETIKYLEDANVRYHETLTDVFNRWVETDKETGGFNLPYICELAKSLEIEIKE